LKFLCPENDKFFKYWKSLRKNELIPLRTNFNPEDIPELLPFITIYQLLSKDNIRVKLAGTAINDRDGYNRTGDNYLDVVPDERKAKASAAFWAARNKPCGMRVIITSKSQKGLVRSIEALGLPIKDKNESPPLLYYCSPAIEKTSLLDIIKGDSLEQVSIKQRDFIDIGAGVPHFED